MALNRHTKIKLGNERVEQSTGSTLNLSGSTIFDSGSTLTILPNRGTGKILVSDNNGVAGWNSIIGSGHTTVKAVGDEIRIFTDVPTTTFGTLNTTGTTALTPSGSESFANAISLHKIAKTGTYSDLIGTPTIGDGILTVSGGTLLTGTGTFCANQVGNTTINVCHSAITTTTATTTQSASFGGTITMIDAVTGNSGHITRYNVKTVTLPTPTPPSDATICISAGTGLTTGGDFTLNQANNKTISLTHVTYTARNVSATGANIISCVVNDGLGHVTNVLCRTLTPSDIGALSASTFNTYTGDTSIIINAAITGGTNGIGHTGRNVCLGGTLSNATSILGGGNALCLGTSANKLSIIDINTSGNALITSGGLLVSSSGATFTDLSAIKQGIKYATDYSATYDSRSLVDKAYVDAVATGLQPHEAVKAATTANITLSGVQIIDEISLIAGDRVLVKNQTTASQNGIYVVAAGTWSRAADFNNDPTGFEVKSGDIVPVISGTTNASSIWILTTPDPITVDTTALEFTLFSKVLGVSAGAGITVTPSGTNQEISINLATNSGLNTTSGLSIDSSIAGSGLTWNSGVLCVNASSGGVTGIPVRFDSSCNLVVNSTDINTSLGSPITGATNIGTGSQIYSGTTNKSLQLRTLIGSGDTTVSTVGDEIRIYSPKSDAIVKQIVQSSHGFNVGDVIGFSGSTYNKAIASISYDGEVLGIVNKVINTNTFEVTQAGYITGLTGLVQGDTYYLSTVTAGAMTSIRPDVDGQIINTVLIAESTTTGWVLPYAGFIVTTGGTGGITFTGLIDTPNNYVNTNYLRSTTNSLEYRTPAQVLSDIDAAASTHVHGEITSGGTVSTNVTIASGDRLLISDATDNFKIKGGVAFGALTTTYLRNDGTFATPPNTTYSLISEAEIINSASTTARLVSGGRLHYWANECGWVSGATNVNNGVKPVSCIFSNKDYRTLEFRSLVGSGSVSVITDENEIIFCGETIPTVNNSTITVTGGTLLTSGGLFTLNQASNQTITINHGSVDRTNTTTAQTATHGGTFTAVDLICSSTEGHITGVRTKTVRLPAAYSHPTGGAMQPTSPLTGADVISQIGVNSLGHVTGHTTRALTAANIGALTSVSLGVSVGTTTMTITNSAGTNAVLGAATSSAAGLVTNTTQTFGGAKTTTIWCGTTCMRTATMCATTIYHSTGTGVRFCGGTGCGSAVDWIATSDCRLKTNIQPISNALSMVNSLCGVCYRLCDDKNNENNVGLIAQDVEKVIPEIVSHSIPSEDDKKYGIEDDKLGLKYDKLTAVLVEAIKEQQKQIEELKTEIDILKMKGN